jgi:hypothetical protein
MVVVAFVVEEGEGRGDGDGIEGNTEVGGGSDVVGLTTRGVGVGAGVITVRGRVCIVAGAFAEFVSCAFTKPTKKIAANNIIPKLETAFLLIILLPF